MTTQHDLGGEVAWAEPAGDLWVATRRGQHIGSVEFMEGHFVVTDSRRTEPATFSSLLDAKASIENPAREVRGDQLSWRRSALEAFLPSYRRSSAS